MALSMAFSNARTDGAKRPPLNGELSRVLTSAHSATPERAETQADLVKQMGTVLAMERPETTAEALRLLRQEFAEYPLALRLVALAASLRT